MLAWKRAPLAALFALALVCVNSSGALAAPPAAARFAAVPSGAQRSPGPLFSQTALDPLGNSFFSWTDTRGPWGSGIFVQRVNAAGTTDWGQPAVPVSVAVGYQSNSHVLPDGSGGVWVVWQHDPTDDMMSTDIYVQHFDTNGAPSFAANGLAVCTATGRQIEPQIVSDGGSGVYVAWQDRRAGVSNNDVYAQHVTALGVVSWTAGGVAVCTASRDQVTPVLVADGVGGAIVAWTDLRVADEEERIFAQRFDATGAMLWTANGVAATTTYVDQFQPSAVSDGAGGVFLVWAELTPALTDIEIRGQRLSAAGTARWGAGGLTVCADPALQFWPRAISDGAHGIDVLWADDRADANHDFYAQRLDSTGALQWSAAGVAVCADPNAQADPYLAPDATGGFIAVWRDLRASAEADLYAQRVNGSGVAQWTANGVVVAAGHGYQFDPGIASDGAGGAIVSWTDSRSRLDQDRLAQRLDASGAPQWASGGVAVNEVGVQSNVVSAAVGGGATAIAWIEKRSGEYDIRARMLDANGAALWNGRGVCVATDLQNSPAIVADGAGGAIVAWTDQRAGANPVLYAQRFDASGTMLWATNGVPVADDTSYTYPPQLVADGAGGVIVVWERRNLGVWEVRVQRLDGAGAPLWGAAGMALADDATEQGNARAVSDGAGGVIVAYQHEPYSMPLLTLVQRIDAAGARPWGAFGLPLNHAGWGQIDPAIAADGLGGAIVAWTDMRAVNSAIYASRVRADGTTVWGSDGSPLTTSSSGQGNVAILSDGAGGATFAYTVSGVGGMYDVVAQRLDSTATLLWSNGGRTVCNATDYQLEPRLAAGGSSDVFVTWSDFRNGTDWKVYAQRMNASGVAQWTANGVAVADTAWDQWTCRPMPDGAGGAVLVWLDKRDTGRGHVYAQRLDVNGVAQWGTGGLVPTFLSLARMHASSDVTHLEWWAGNSVQLTVAVERRETNGGWESLATLTGDGTGLFVYDDRAITPGGRYAYRVSVVSGGAALSSTETWVDVPVRSRLALAGTWPNPARRELRVAFALTGRAPARLELLDVAGRVAKRWALDGFGAGEHAVELGETGAFAPGVYVLQLTEGASRTQRRVTIVR
ncbi:MAG: hypothetical protein HZA61_13600 [Candidatus Eisenbacteria bacterium]|uniref:T9SS type A sorting domain-containing protein n=1 Tax=Eiseniibacteriota bacterium TaxID=2212470 RepID=A0A933W9D8_UNCEI|nr:hypothetical protein [Candidatus Eisenbacteria bacterium]